MKNSPLHLLHHYDNKCHPSTLETHPQVLWDHHSKPQPTGTGQSLHKHNWQAWSPALLTQKRPPQQNNTSRLQPQRHTPCSPPEIPHHPDTEAGRLAHRAQQADWAKTHGLNAFCHRINPLSHLTRNTPSQLRGVLHAWVCRPHGTSRWQHMQRHNMALHLHEQSWWAICSRILKQTHAAANIQLVMVDDYGTTWQEVQGKEEGPLN